MEKPEGKVPHVRITVIVESFEGADVHQVTYVLRDSESLRISQDRKVDPVFDVGGNPAGFDVGPTTLPVSGEIAGHRTTKRPRAPADPVED